MSASRRTLELPGPFRMRRGGVLPEVEIVCETWGALAPARDNVVLIVTGLSPSAHAAATAEDPTPGWWEPMIGPGHPIDTERFHVVCVNSLGSCHGSTGAASVDPRSGARYALQFPVLSVEDIAAAAYEALRTMGIERVRAVVGPSLGGMTALAYAAQRGEEVGALVVISGACRSTPFALSIRSLQREMIRTDPHWQGGDYPDGGGPVNGMRLARKLGLISYRSAREWNERFGRERVAVGKAGLFGVEFEVEAYLEMHAQKFVGSFDANCYLYLSRAMDLFDLAEHGGTLEAGLARIRAGQTLVIGVETDFLFPLDQQAEIAQGLRALGRDVRFEALPSIQGHDSFLVDIDRFGPVLADFMAGI